MASVCFYFQVHQPYRLRPYAADATDPFYFDTGMNREICEKVAEKCYRPATKKLLDLVKRYEGEFKVSFSITGTVLEQFEAWAPDVLELFQELVATGSCELLAETSHHSLTFLASKQEFDAQVTAHGALMKRLFDIKPDVFRNTELTYSNELAAHIAGAHPFRAIVCEGVDRHLGYRSPAYVYAPPINGAPGDPTESSVALLLKNYSLSDDIAFRFSNREWPRWPLTADEFANWVNEINGDGYLCNLFMDYETLGEHQWADTGIFEFLDVLPEKILKLNHGHNDFVSVSEAVERYAPIGFYDVPETISWADSERDLTAWLGNEMQNQASQALYELEAPVRDAHQRGSDEYVLEDWRKLTTSDHLYYMSTKFWSDGDVHKYFSPYENPYEAYVNFMNVVDSMRRRVGARRGIRDTGEEK